MSDGVTITLTFRLKPEVADAFCENLPDALHETVAFPGFRDIRVIRSAADRNRVMFFETWDSEADYDAYIAFRTETGMMDQFAELMAEPPVKEVWPILVVSR